MLPQSLADKIAAHESERGNRVIAVGTTSMRALEAAARDAEPMPVAPLAEASRRRPISSSRQAMNFALSTGS